MNTSLRSLLSRELNAAICNLFITMLYYAQFVSTVNFIYRYLGIVRNCQLNGKGYVGMLATLMAILSAFFIWDYLLTVPNDVSEFVMTDKYIGIFGDRTNFINNKADLRTCLRGDAVNHNYNYFSILTKN
jgi:hypothetical protein